jgi:hypothetical protein
MIVPETLPAAQPSKESVRRFNPPSRFLATRITCPALRQPSCWRRHRRRSPRRRTLPRCDGFRLQHLVNIPPTGDCCHTPAINHAAEDDALAHFATPWISISPRSGRWKRRSEELILLRYLHPSSCPRVEAVTEKLSLIPLDLPVFSCSSATHAGSCAVSCGFSAAICGFFCVICVFSR